MPRPHENLRSKRNDTPGGVLVTGGNGFIGRALCCLLAARGTPVRSLDRERPRKPGGAQRYPTESCDITDSVALERVFRAHPADVVVHLASLLPTASRRDPQGATRVNILGSANVLRAASRFGARRVIFGSSVSVYGRLHGARPKPVSETDAAGFDELYGAGKRYVEVLGEQYLREKKLEFVALRIATVI